MCLLTLCEVRGTWPTEYKDIDEHIHEGDRKIIGYFFKCFAAVFAARDQNPSWAVSLHDTLIHRIGQSLPIIPRRMLKIHSAASPIGDTRGSYQPCLRGRGTHPR